MPSKINQVLRVLFAFQFDYRSRAAAMLKTNKTLGKKLVSHTFIKSSSKFYNTIQNLQLRSDRKTRNQIQGYLVFLDIIHNFGKLKRPKKLQHKMSANFHSSRDAWFLKVKQPTPTRPPPTKIATAHSHRHHITCYLQKRDLYFHSFVHPQLLWMPGRKIHIRHP